MSHNRKAASAPCTRLLWAHPDLHLYLLTQPSCFTFQQNALKILPGSQTLVREQDEEGHFTVSKAAIPGLHGAPDPGHPNTIWPPPGTAVAPKETIHPSRSDRLESLATSMLPQVNERGHVSGDRVDPAPRAPGRLPDIPTPGSPWSPHLHALTSEGEYTERTRVAGPHRARSASS